MQFAKWKNEYWTKYVLCQFVIKNSIRIFERTVVNHIFFYDLCLGYLLPGLSFLYERLINQFFREIRVLHIKFCCHS